MFDTKTKQPVRTVEAEIRVGIYDLSTCSGYTNKSLYPHFTLHCTLVACASNYVEGPEQESETRKK